MTGLLDHNDSFHDHDSALADQKSLLNLYHKFGSITRPYLADAIREERSNIALRDWVTAASNMFGNLLDSCRPGELQELEASELRATKERLIRKIEEDVDEVNDHELDLLIENTSQSIINAWLTDLNRFYIPGESLNSFLMRRGAEKGLFERALIPYSVDNFRDVFVHAMGILSEELSSSDDSRVALPMGLILLPETQDADGFRQFTIYREVDVPNATEEANNYEARELPISPHVITDFAVESFCLRQIKLWRKIIVNNFVPGVVLHPQMAVPLSIEDTFMEKTVNLGQLELGPVSLESDQYAGIMSNFTNNLRDANLHEIAEGISIHFEEEDMLLQGDSDGETSMLSTDIKLFRAMRSATELEFAKAS